MKLDLLAFLLFLLKRGRPLGVISEFPHLKLKVIHMTLLEIVGLSDLL
jgi:hypothetical protein